MESIKVLLETQNPMQAPISLEGVTRDRSSRALTPNPKPIYSTPLGDVGFRNLKMFKHRGIRNRLRKSTSLNPIEEGQSTNYDDASSQGETQGQAIYQDHVTLQDEVDPPIPYRICGPHNVPDAGSTQTIISFPHVSNSRSELIAVTCNAQACWSCRRFSILDKGYEALSCACSPQFRINEPVELEFAFTRTIPDVRMGGRAAVPEIRHLCTIFNWPGIGISGVSTVAHGQEGLVLKLPMPQTEDQYWDYSLVCDDEVWFKALFGL